MLSSIIIPILDSPIIDQVLQRLEEQSARSMIGEILVVGRDQPGLVRETSLVKMVDTFQPVSASRARNIGIEIAQNDLLIFLDSDCLPEPDWLAQHLAAHANGHLVIGGGIEPNGPGYWRLTYNLAMFHEFFATAVEGPRDYLPTLNLSVARTVIAETGILNESLARGQDIEWTMRMAEANYQPYFWPAATVLHHHNRNRLASVWRDCARSGYYMRQLRLQNPDYLLAPSWLRYAWAVLLFSPAIATAVTVRIVTKRPSVILRHWYTIPGIYLTKLAWCWGASGNRISLDARTKGRPNDKV